MFQGTASDVRYVLRVLLRSPGFAAVAVLSLALGIGANTAMFGVVRTLLLTPLPVESPAELALVTWRKEGKVDISQNGSTSYTDPADGADLRSNFSHPLYRALRDATPVGADLFGFAFIRGVSVAVGEQPAFLAGGAMVDGRYFPALRVGMAVGRPLTADDDRPGAPLVAVLSHSFWMRTFGGDRGVVGRSVRVNGVSAEVVGVTADGFRGLSMGGFFPQTDVTVPLSAQPVVHPRLSPGEDLFASEDTYWLRLMVRVRQGTGTEGVESALAAAFRSAPSPLLTMDEHLPVLRLIPGSQGAQPVRPQMARLLYLLLGVVGMVLLIACVNLASLMLARGVSRQREMAVRRALGGGRARLLRQAVLESVVLAAAGTLAGLGLTLGGRRFLSDLLTGSLGSGAFGNVDMGVVLDPWVLAATAALGMAATVLFGFLPALRLSHLDPVAWLRDRAAGSSSPRLTVGRWLIALQIAVSVPLVVGAGLLLRSVANLGAVELGFEPRGLVSFQVDPGYTRLPEEQYGRLYQELLARVGEVPGVRSVTLMENMLLSGLVSNSSTTVDDRRVVVFFNGVGPAFLETLGMRLVAGRMPGIQDGGDAPLVAAVNETAVRELFGGSSPLGQTFRMGSREFQIVGVVNDTPYRSQRDPAPATLYPSAFQRSAWGGYHMVLRTDMPPARLEAAVREAVYRVDANLPVPELRSQSDLIAQSTARERVFTQLLTLFGGFALFLAAIGLHGVTSYAVTRRTSEIGVRVAVGARPQQILWLVLRQVVVLAAAGLAVGVPLALSVAPLVGSLLYGVEPANPLTVVTSAVVMMGVAVAAGLLPALRAARLDALVALSRE
jgi:predicted permease